MGTTVAELRRSTVVALAAGARLTFTNSRVRHGALVIAVHEAAFKTGCRDA
jgi:hypothetical protein